MQAIEDARALLAQVSLLRDVRFHLLDTSGEILASVGNGKELFMLREGVVVPVSLGEGRSFLSLPVRKGADESCQMVASFPELQRNQVEGLVGALHAVLARTTEVEYEIEDMSRNLVQIFEEYSTLMELSQVLPGSADVEDLAEKVLTQLCTATGSRQGLFALRDAASSSYRILMWVSRDGGTEYRRRPLTCDVAYSLGEGLIGRVLREGRCIYFNSLHEAGSELTTAERLAGRNLLASPMPFTTPQGNQILGALCLMDREDAWASTGVDFSSSQQRLAEAIGIHVASLIGTAQLVELRKELEMGRTIQTALLPQSAPATEGFDTAGRHRQARLVGGDYYDFIRVGRDATVIVIGDVSGHNLASGMMMVMARALLRNVAQRGAGPGEILEELSKGLYDDLTDNDRFITLFVARLKDGGRQMEFASAGHNPPLLWRKARGRFEELEAEGTVIGWACHQTFEEETVTLAPGDLVVMYTDGITEATASTGEMFGEERLKGVVETSRHMASAKILDRIFLAVGDFSGGDEGDDLTAVVMRAV